LQTRPGQADLPTPTQHEQALRSNPVNFEQ
jgi:hypothetical protein